MRVRQDEEARAEFLSRAERAGQPQRLHLYEGLSREVLAWMISGDGYWQSFDFVHLAAPAGGPELLADACQAWDLLKPGGVMVFCQCRVKEDTRLGVEAFLTVFGSRLERVLEDERLVVRKLR